ncbi:MAG: hypothetical protein EBY70_04210 [Burkholderiaceae bacterium]|nr:hypothetical protein [Burkholderiaceae bacterium]
MIQAFGSLAISFFLFTHSALADSRQSGYQLLSPTNQAMQNDMNLNPALFAVMDGEALWQEKSQANGKSCASCHGDVKQSMRGVFATYPKIMQGVLFPRRILPVIPFIGLNGKEWDRCNAA